MPFISCFCLKKSDENNVWNKDRGNWRKMMDNVEFHNLYCLSDTEVLENSGKWVRNVECMGMMVILKRFLIGKQVGKRLFRRAV